jgi:hypothetical protein
MANVAFRREWRAQWTARPWTLRLFVPAGVASVVYSGAVQREPLNFWNVVLTLLVLGFYKGVWDGDRRMWLLFTMLFAAGLVVSVIASVHEPGSLLGVALSGASLMLLLVEPTQSWVSERTESARPPAARPS